MPASSSGRARGSRGESGVRLARVPVDPTPESISAFAQNAPDDTPLVMLNLLRFREVADDPDGQPNRSGREAYMRYFELAEPFFSGVGGRIEWQGTAHEPLIAPPNERWDACALARYPSKAAFLEMVMNPDYQAITVHRTAALADSRLVPMVEADLA
jgi:uncharacterized protein (DUF1330 family)